MGIEVEESACVCGCCFRLRFSRPYDVVEDNNDEEKAEAEAEAEAEEEAEEEEEEEEDPNLLLKN